MEIWKIENGKISKNWKYGMFEKSKIGNMENLEKLKVQKLGERKWENMKKIVNLENWKYGKCEKYVTRKYQKN